MASSSASLLPEPMLKWAVCAESPSSTSGTRPCTVSSQCTHSAQVTRGKRIHWADPRRCAALLISGSPPSTSAKSDSQNAIDSPSDMSAIPACSHTSCGVSTMNVLVSPSN